MEIQYIPRIGDKSETVVGDLLEIKWETRIGDLLEIKWETHIGDLSETVIGDLLDTNWYIFTIQSTSKILYRSQDHV